MSIRNRGANEGKDREERDGVQQRRIRKWKLGRVSRRLVRQEEDEEREEYADRETGAIDGSPYRIIVPPSASGDMTRIGQREHIERSCAPISRQERLGE